MCGHMASIVLGVQAYAVPFSTSVDMSVSSLSVPVIQAYQPTKWYLKLHTAYHIWPYFTVATSEAWKTICMDIGGHWAAQSSLVVALHLRSSFGGGINVFDQVWWCVVAVWLCQSADTRTTPRSSCGGHYKWWSLVRSEVWLGVLRLRLVGVQWSSVVFRLQQGAGLQAASVGLVLSQAV